jgi:hypothetical protein
MPRVENEDVLEIIETTIEDVRPFIEVASLLVTELLGNSSLSTEHLAQIEKWLAAHFVAIRDPRLVQERIGDVSVKYSTGSMTYSNSMKDAAGLNETTYGKQVLLLDTTGILREKLGKPKARFEAIG